MNVTYKCNNGSAFISADGVNRMMASYEDVEELLINENLIEMLKYFHHRDKRELFYLDGKKHTLDKAAFATGAYAVTSSIVVPFLSSCDVVSNEFAAGFSIGVLSTGAAVCILNKYILPHNKAREGLRECINYEEQKIHELKGKIEDIKSNSQIDKSTREEVVIDDREAKKRIQDILNFIFYLGGNRKKVLKMYQEMSLFKFLKEKMEITDLGAISEIESYVYYYFEEELEKGNSYVKKGN